jgi:hypothetical protein
LTRNLVRLIGAVAVLAPGLHVASDVLEWLAHGFTPLQLWLSYLAFVAMPAVFLGLYAAQRPQIELFGLVGAIVYGAAFIYFAHTALYALAERIATYAALWARLGALYTLHGGLMILGGLLFGGASLRARRLPRWTVLAFLSGIALNLILGLLPTPDILQTAGSTLRNAGIMGMGYTLLAGRNEDRAV